MDSGPTVGDTQGWQRGPGGEGRSRAEVGGEGGGGREMDCRRVGRSGVEGRPGLSGKTDELGERQLRALGLWEGVKRVRQRGFFAG